MRKRRVTVGDVAQAAGVSLMTVSRAINGREGIGKETRDRIVTLARQMGYHPSQIARSLATRQTATLGLMVPDVSNPFFALIARGAEDAAFENGYNVFLVNSAEAVERERLALDSLWAKEVDGVIVCSSRLPQEALQTAIERFPQMVLVNRELEQLPDNAATINVDDRAGAEMAIGRLVLGGRRRIALIAGPESSLSSQRRLAGYRAGLAVHGLLERTPFDHGLNSADPGQAEAGGWAVHCAPTTQGGYQTAQRLLAAHPDLDAFLAYNDLAALGALQACQEAGRRVPQDVAVIGVDDIPLASLVKPKLTTLSVDQYEIGRQALALLVAMLRDETPPARAVTIRPVLVGRESG